MTIKTLRLDSAYRFQIPIAYLASLNIQEDDMVYFYLEGLIVHVKKLDEEVCTFCGSIDKVAKFDDFYACHTCRLNADIYADIVHKGYAKQRVYPQKRITLPFKIRQRLPYPDLAKHTVTLELKEADMLLRIIHPG